MYFYLLSFSQFKYGLKSCIPSLPLLIWRISILADSSNLRIDVDNSECICHVPCKGLYGLPTTNDLKEIWSFVKVREICWNQFRLNETSLLTTLNCDRRCNILFSFSRVDVALCSDKKTLFQFVLNYISRLSFRCSCK